MWIINNVDEIDGEDGFYIIQHPTYKWNEYFIIVKDSLIQSVIKACGVTGMKNGDDMDVGVTLYTDSGRKFNYECDMKEAQEILMQFAEMVDETDSKEPTPCPEQ